MELISIVLLYVQYAVAAAVIAVIALMLVRLVVNYADLNPFSRPVLFVRQLSDPLVGPVRLSLLRFGFSPNLAPLVTILIAILVGWFAVQLIGSVLSTLGGVILSLQQRSFLLLIGFLLYGLLAVYSLLIFIRIVFSWGLSSINPVMRFLIRATEPILAPFRRLIPPLGMFDISPIIVLFLLRLFQEAIAGTLLIR
jgi:YggT family protein